MTVHHIGYLVKSIDRASVKFFGELGYRNEGTTVYDEFRKINILFMVNGDYRIELIESAADDSMTGGLIKKLGVGPYHICYQVDSIEEAKVELEKQRYVMTAAPEAAPALDGRRVAFFYHRDIGLIELLEVKQ